MKKAPVETKITTVEFRNHFSKVSKDRFENDPSVLEEAVEEAEDLRGTEKAKVWSDRLNSVPEKVEILEQMGKMRDAAPGEDGVRLSYLLKGGTRMHDRIVEIVQYMFLNDAEKWEDSLKSGVVVPLFKMKGDRDDPGNYRGVCLLSLASRILARILAARLQVWAEDVGILDDNQQGFRKGRSTGDATQTMVRLKEDAEDLERRRVGEEVDDKDVLVARLLDLKKAYPRVNKPALWKLLERYGLDGNYLRALKDLHETTEYRVRGKAGLSEEWVPERGLREGCPSSPPLFNIFHQAVMRVARKERLKLAEETGKVAGVVFKWVPGSAFPSAPLWEKTNSEAVEVKIDKSLFADDTTILGNAEELQQGVDKTKEVMGRFEERNNDSKEEELAFGKEESGQVRMLGSWMGWKEDVDQRLKRGSKTWWMTKKRLKGAKISKRLQGRIVEACVESTLLFDCHVRTWRISEINRLQRQVDRAYRSVWSRGNEPPLMQMQREGRNMADVRKDLGVMSIRWKIEKRVLERIGHVMRMEDGRIVKAVVLGWVEQLERWERVKGSRRKTMLYWKKLLREAGIDYTRIGQLTKDRKKWKEVVRERMEVLRQWEWSRGHKWQGEVPEKRDATREERTDLVFMCDYCGKVCKSKAGLTIHVKRMHEESVAKKKFSCDKCGEVFKQEANVRNHEKVCGGKSEDGRKKCDKCQKSYAKSYIARHRRACAAEDGAIGGEEEAVPAARVYRRGWGPCPKCGKIMSKTNIARHLREVCKDDGAGL